ncbi:glycoside hydrolase family 97 protein [Draconibacterium sp.]|nr:glycoside hydrolase family 97 protein [Draconibacterium sp.]
MKRYIVSVFIFFLALSFCNSLKKNGCFSPDKNIEIVVQKGKPDYSFSVVLAGDTIIKNSAFGIVLDEVEYDFSKNLTLTNTGEIAIDETYEMKVGKQLVRRNNCNQISLEFENEFENKIVVDFRVYNDGVAYRYKLANNKETSVVHENSEFSFNSISNIWSIPYSSGDERIFEKSIAANEHAKTTLSFPVLIETESKKWALISEADVSNYSLSSGQFKGNSLTYVFSNEKIAENTVAENFISPWRVIIVGEQLGTIIESCLIDHLAPTAGTMDYSWVEPGVTSFPWWGDNLANSYPDILKNYFDLSAEMNWRYVEFDIPLIGSPAMAAEKWKSVDWIKDVVDYGLRKGVLCYGWDDIKNLNTPEKRASIFLKYNEFGIRGIKVDFVNSYTQKTRKLVEEVIQDAVKYKLMVSFHGAQSPRGFARTYPHVVTFEAVKGSEYYLDINGGKGVPPGHNCTLPFTRNVLGSMDYTPVAFSSKVRTTSMAHELALSIIFESGWQGICDVPEAYLNSVAKPLLSKLYATWDETKLLDGYPGDYCCMARRKGKSWYVAGINAGEARMVSFKLPVSEKVNVKVYTDVKNEHSKLQIIETEISEDKPFEITMDKNGGFAFVIE